MHESMFEIIHEPGIIFLIRGEILYNEIFKFIDEIRGLFILIFFDLDFVYLDPSHT